MSSLAGIYVDKGDYANASMLAEKYDSLTQQCFKGDNEEYLQSRRVAGYFFSLTERMDKAERYYQEALRVSKKIWKENSVEYAKLLRNVGTMYYNSGLYKKSTELLKEAAAIFEKSDSTVYDQLADIYHKLGGSFDLRAEKTNEEFYLRKVIVLDFDINENIIAVPFLLDIKHAIKLLKYSNEFKEILMYYDK